MRADLTTSLYLSALGGSEWFKTGATYRPANESYPMSCQYWQPPALTYMNSGFNRFVVGVGGKLWKGSETCGQCLEIKSQYRVILVVIADYCPPPCTPMQLDLNPMASAALSVSKTQPRNHYNLTARKVDCHWGIEMSFYLDKGSSVYNWYMIPLYIKRPLKSVKVLGQYAYHDLYGRWVIGFKKKFPLLGSRVEILVDEVKKVFIQF